MVPLLFGSPATSAPNTTPGSKKPPKTTTTRPTTTTSTVAPTTTTTLPVTTTTSTPLPVVDPVLLAAGDIASCASTGDETTAALLNANLGAVVATLGDNVYDNGTPAEYTNCYDPSWGASKARTNPSPGNHDYNTAGAGGYYGYFGAAAGDPAKGY